MPVAAILKLRQNDHRCTHNKFAESLRFWKGAETRLKRRSFRKVLRRFNFLSGRYLADYTGGKSAQPKDSFRVETLVLDQRPSARG